MWILPAERVFEINETSKLLLECAFEANPANDTSVAWIRNGEKISPASLTSDDDEDDAGNENDENNIGSSIGAKEGTYFLSIDNINRSQAGEYRCSITNSIGEGISDNAINVSVLCMYGKHLFYFLYCVVFFPVKIYIDFLQEVSDLFSKKYIF